MQQLRAFLRSEPCTVYRSNNTIAMELTAILLKPAHSEGKNEAAYGTPQE
jgi:hypothetical protein